MVIEVDPVKFREWLESEPDGTEYGPPDSCRTSPLTKYLVQITGNHTACYSAGEYVYMDKDLTIHQLTAPDWTVSFVMLLVWSRTPVVMKADALRVLTAALR